jgi:DNA-binding transcriptional LysR family regulator
MAKAGTRLAISQPAISKAISAMEHTFGVRLFERSSRGIEPTRYGQALIRRSRAVFDELRQSVKDIEFLSDPTVGEVRIGCTPPLAAGLVTEVISRLTRDHPRITFQLVENDPIPLIRELDARNVELVLARMPGGQVAEHMDVEIFYHDAFVVVAGMQNPWVRRRKAIRLADLVDEPWALMPTETFTRSAVQEAFLAEGLEPPRRTVVSPSAGMRNSLLATGLFLSTLPATALKFPAGYPPIKALPIELPTTRRPVGLITLKNRSLSPVTQLFVDRTREVVKSIAGGKQVAARRRASA